MKVLRTPDERFAALPGYPFEPRYVDLDGLRMHYVDEGTPTADPVLLLHGEPTWSYLYRLMIPVFVNAGHRVVAPDLIGFGRSDKPAAIEDYTYARHLAWTGGLLEALDLRRVTLVCQDWGGMIGLRLVAGQPERFARVVVANTGLATGRRELPEIWHAFRTMVVSAEDLQIGRIVDAGTLRSLPPEIIAAYDAPFPDDAYKAGARAFPDLIPQDPDHPEAQANRQAWATLGDLDLPLLTAFSDRDPITAGGERPFQRLRGAKGQPHTTITAAGHFLQEDQGPKFAEVAISFVAATRS